MQRTGDSYEVIGTRNRVVTLVVILITLAIINSLASEFPRSAEHLVGSFFVENLIKTITLVIMLVLVRPLRHSLAVLICYYMRRSLKVYEYEDRPKMGSNINILSRGVGEGMELYPWLAELLEPFSDRVTREEAVSAVLNCSLEAI